MKRPLVLIVLAVVALLYAADGSVRLFTAVATGAVRSEPWESVSEFLFVAFNIFIAVGILRLHPATRIAALIACWVVFIGIALLLLRHLLALERVPALMLVAAAAMLALAVWFHWQLRRESIRSLFRSRHEATPTA